MLRCRTRRASPWGYTDDHVPETEFAVDSPLEGAGFEPSVPLWVLTVSGPPSVVSVTLPPLSLRQNGNTLSRPGTGSPSGGESAAKLASVSLRDTRIAQLVIGRMLDPGSGDRLRPCDSAVRFRASCPSARRAANQSARPRPADASARHCQEAPCGRHRSGRPPDRRR
jgi:hypothetical protein